MARPHYPYFNVKAREKSPYLAVHIHLEPNSTPIRISTGETDRERAGEEGRKIFIEYLARIGAVTEDTSGDVSTEQLCSEYLDERELTGGAAPSYMKSLHQVYATHLIPHFPLIGQLTHEAWEDAKLRMRADELGWATIAKVTINVNTLLAWALHKKKIAVHPKLVAPSKKAIRREEEKRRAMSPDEKQAFLWAVALLAVRYEEWHRWDEAREVREALRWYIVAFETGMRKGELNSLAKRWVDFDLGLILIPARDQKSAEAEPPIDMTSLAAEAIKSQLEERQITDPGATIFPVKEHRKVWAHAIKEAGIDSLGLTPHHSARHTCLTEIARSGDVLAVKSQARHKDVSTSMKYIHVGIEAVRRARASVSGVC